MHRPVRPVDIGRKRHAVAHHQIALDDDPASVGIRHCSWSPLLVFSAAERGSCPHPRAQSRLGHDRLPSPNRAPGGPRLPRPDGQQSTG